MLLYHNKTSITNKKSQMPYFDFYLALNLNNIILLFSHQSPIFHNKAILSFIYSLVSEHPHPPLTRSPFSSLEKACFRAAFAYRFERLRRELGVMLDYPTNYKKYYKSFWEGVRGRTFLKKSSSRLPPISQHSST